MTMYSEYFELHFASIRSHSSRSDILTLWGLLKRPPWLVPLVPRSIMRREKYIIRYDTNYTISATQWPSV